MGLSVTVMDRSALAVTVVVAGCAVVATIGWSSKTTQLPYRKAQCRCYSQSGSNADDEVKTPLPAANDDAVKVDRTTCTLPPAWCTTIIHQDSDSDTKVVHSGQGIGERVGGQC